MKRILLFGAGKSATVLIDYLKKTASENHWEVTVADSHLETVLLKTGGHPSLIPLQINITDEARRKELIAKADIVISMMPPALHYLVALDCIAFKKHLLTASYIDENIRQLANSIRDKGIFFLCEMGLDPGIDHMSAMKLVEGVKAKGGMINLFKSHCGGLVAPESDDNPWHYKISWNPASVALAGKAGAVYKENNEIKKIAYHDVFKDHGKVDVPKMGMYEWYANRDSLSYLSLYGMEATATFMRTTLRAQGFCNGWQQVIELKLTNEEKIYQSDGLSVADFFLQHFEKNNFSQVLDLINSNPLLQKQFECLGLNDHTTIINKGLCSAADVLQFLLETKLPLRPTDKDMIIMLHEIEYSINGRSSKISSSLVVKGEDNLRTAMAKTVGLPLGIAAKLILEGKINETGLHIPVMASIYEPVLKELEENGIVFEETEE